MKKGKFAMLLVLVTIMIAMVGCQSQQVNQPKEKAGTESSKPVETEQKKEELAAQANPVVILMSEPRDSNPEDIEKVKKYIEEQSGVKFEVRNVKAASNDDFQQLINVNLASGGIDVVLVNSKEMYTQLLQSGRVQSINESLQQYGTDLLNVYPADSWKAVSDSKGDIYGLPRQSILASETIVIRKDWREALNMAPITTLAQFEEYLRAVKKADFAANGKLDIIPLLSNQSDYSSFDKTLLYVFTGNSPFNNQLDEKGNIIPNYMDPKYKDYLGKLAEWSKEELLYSGMLSVKKAQADDLIIANRVGAFAGWYSDYIRPMEKLRETVPDADYEVITLEALDGSPYKFHHKDPYGQRAVFVEGSKNVDYAIKLFNWMMASPENYFSTKWGTYGEYWDFVDKEKGTAVRLKGAEDPTTSYNYAFSMMFYGPWDFRSDTPDFVNSYYYSAWDYFEQNKDHFIQEPDWFMNYELKGTPVYSTQEDGRTLIMENRAKIIVNSESLDTWDKTIEQYRKMFADKYSEIATQQYNEFVSNNK